jgi:hypothetical protein
MNGNARIVQIRVSPGEVPKRPAPSARLTPRGPQSDAERDREPDRALCLIAQERIRPLVENLVGEGVDWNPVVPGAYLRLGSEVIAQVTRYAAPCGNNITASLRGRGCSRASQNCFFVNSRVYVHGDPVQLLTDDEALAPIGSR